MFYRILYFFLIISIVKGQNVENEAPKQLAVQDEYKQGKNYQVEVSIIGHYLYNVNVKYKISDQMNFGVKLPVVPKMILHDLGFAFSTGLIFKSEKSFNLNSEVGFVVGNTLLFATSVFAGCYYHQEIGLCGGPYFYFNLEPIYLFGKNEHASYTGEIGLGIAL